MPASNEQLEARIAAAEHRPGSIPAHGKGDNGENRVRFSGGF